MLFVGVDWGERHHDLCLLDQAGRVLAARRIADGLPRPTTPAPAIPIQGPALHLLGGFCIASGPRHTEPLAFSRR